LTVTLKNQTAEYNGQEPTVSQSAYDITGSVIGSDNLALVLTKASGVNVGKYAINGTASNGNYIVTINAGEYEITLRAVTVTLSKQISQYDGSEPTISQSAWSVTSGSIVGSDNLNLVLTKVAGINVGKYDINATYTNANYNVTIISGVYEIAVVVLTVTLHDQSSQYDGQEPTIDQNAYDISGNVGGGDLGLVLTKAAGVNVGVYDIEASTNANYNVTIIPGEYTITAVELTVTLNNQTAEYNGQEPTIDQNAYDMTGSLIGSDNLGLDLTKVAGVNVDTYAISATWTNGNYTVTIVSGEYAITAVALTVKLTNQSSQYDGQEPTVNQAAYSITSGSVIGSDNLGLVLKKVSGVNKGTYAISATVSNANYTVTIVSGVYTITAVALTVTLNNQTSEYDGKEPVINQNAYGISGSLVGSDNLGLVLRKTVGVNAGTYAINATVSNANYKITIVSGIYTITAVELTVTIADQSSAYDGNEPTVAQDAWSVTDGSVVDGDDLGIILFKAAGSEVGDYIISGSWNNDNYTVTIVDGTYQISAEKVGTKSKMESLWDYFLLLSTSLFLMMFVVRRDKEKKKII
jgi:hypothetical protein